MYEEGGGAGLKYFSYQMSTGEKFDGKVGYKTAEDCIKLNSKCKLHYRDAELKMTAADIGAIVDKVGEALDWYASVSAASTKGRRRRRRRRRRLLQDTLESTISGEPIKGV